jgi:hypothetical protein
LDLRVDWPGLAVQFLKSIAIAGVVAGSLGWLLHRLQDGGAFAVLPALAVYFPLVGAGTLLIGGQGGELVRNGIGRMLAALKPARRQGN